MSDDIEPDGPDEPAILSGSEDLRIAPEVLTKASERAGLEDAEITPPTEALITRWRQDPFARGSYSYLAVGSSNSDRDALRVSVGHVHFAGEATSNDYAATVHGALLEGRSAAARIMHVANADDEIVIVGAGICGLAAARTLTDEGFAVIVLEARNRIGGRIHTTESLGFPLDVGAAWIHGTDDNPLTELAGAAGVDTATTEWDELVVYDRRGDVVDSADLDTISDFLRNLDPADGRTIAEILDDEFAEADEETAAIAIYAVTSNIEHDLAASANDLTAASVRVGEEFDGDEVVFPGGYAGVLRPLIQGLRIATDQVVDRVEWDDTGVTLGVSNAATIATDHVLITAPLGVLKARDIEFTPELPADKLAAIDRLGMGVLDRVVLRFEERFWDDRDVIGFVGNEPGLFVEWFDLTDLVGEPVLVGFNAGDVADELASRSDEQIIAEAMRALVTMYGS